MDKEWQRRYYLNRYHERRAWAIAVLGGRCVICDSDEQLEIDHIDPLTKSFNISKLWGVAAETFVAELMKCQVLCKPHHKEKSDDEERTSKHGTWGRYKRQKCRCQICRDFVAARQREYRASRRVGVDG